MDHFRRDDNERATDFLAGAFDWLLGGLRGMWPSIVDRDMFPLPYQKTHLPSVCVV